MKSFIMFLNLIFFVICIAVAALIDTTIGEQVGSLVIAAGNAFAFELGRRCD